MQVSRQTNSYQDLNVQPVPKKQLENGNIETQFGV